AAEPVAPEMFEPAAQAVEAPVSNAAPVAEDAPAVAGASETTDETTADAHDEAVLDLIAAEMSAHDPIVDDFEMAAAEAFVVEPAPPELAAESIESIAAQAEPAAAPSVPQAAPAQLAPD